MEEGMKNVISKGESAVWMKEVDEYVGLPKRLDNSIVKMLNKGEYVDCGECDDLKDVCSLLLCKSRSILKNESFSKQSRELFSRLRFNIVELQSKLKFLSYLYEKDINDSDIAFESGNLNSPEKVEDNKYIHKNELKQLKVSIEHTKSECMNLISDIFDLRKEINIESEDLKKELDTIADLESQAKELECQVQEMEGMFTEEVKYSMNELDIIYEQESQLLNDYKNVVSKEQFFINTEIKEKIDKEGANNLKLKSYHDELNCFYENKVKSVKKIDTINQDLFRYYNELMTVVMMLFDCTISLEGEDNNIDMSGLVESQNHCIHIKFNKRTQSFLLTFDKNGCFCSIKCITPKWHHLNDEEDNRIKEILRVSKEYKNVLYAIIHLHKLLSDV